MHASGATRVWRRKLTAEASTGLVAVEVIVPNQTLRAFEPATGLVPVEVTFANQTAPLPRPSSPRGSPPWDDVRSETSLHGDKPRGGESPCARHGLVAKPAVHRDEPGGELNATFPMAVRSARLNLCPILAVLETCGRSLIRRHRPSRWLAYRRLVFRAGTRAAFPRVSGRGRSECAHNLGPGSHHSC